jgi:ankyrin repeat protein
MFNGCRKVIIDDIRKDDVLDDMKQFAQYEADKYALKLSDECIRCICLCSNGCYLYTKIYFQVVVQNRLMPLDQTPPATLNGLFYAIFTVLFDRLAPIAQLTVRRLFSLLLCSPTSSISVDQARNLLMTQTHLGQLPEILNQLEQLQLIRIQQEPVESAVSTALSQNISWIDSGGTSKPDSPETPETPKALQDLLQPVIRVRWTPLLRWLSEVKHCGQRFHCSKQVGHLLYVLNNPNSQDGSTLAHHVQATSLDLIVSNLQAVLFLIFCNPQQLTCLPCSIRVPSTQPQLNVSHPSHPLIGYIESCAQVNTCRSPGNDDSNQDNTEAELISELLGDLQSGDLQFPVGSFEIASEPCDFDLNHNSFHIPDANLFSAVQNAALWANGTGGGALPTIMVPPPNLTLKPILNQVSPFDDSLNDLSNSKVVFEPCQIDPVTGTFDMQQLSDAITAGDEGLLKLLLDSCPRLLYSYDDRGLTPLLHAINVDCSDHLLRLLLSYELDINQPSEQLQLTPLMLAAAHDRLASVELLLEMDADVHAKHTFGHTALACAVRFGASVPIVELLIGWGSRADECDHFGRSLVTLSVISTSACSFVTVANSAASELPTPDANDKSEKRLSITSIKALDKPDVKAKATKPNPMVMLRRQMSQYPSTGQGKRRSLIECVPQFRANRLMTGSAVAAQATWVRASQMLEPNNRPVRPNTSYEHRLLHVQPQHLQADVQQRELNALQVIRQLVDGGADVTQLDHDGRGALHWASAAGASPLLLDYLTQLVGRKQLQQPDSNGWLPVHWAAAAGKVPLLKSLASDGLLHQLTNDRLSVLGCAVRANQFDAVIALVRRCGARLDQLDAQRRSVMNWVVGACGVRLKELRRLRQAKKQRKSRAPSCCTSVGASDCKSIESFDGRPDAIDLIDRLVDLPKRLLNSLIDSIDDELRDCLNAINGTEYIQKATGADGDLDDEEGDLDDDENADEDDEGDDHLEEVKEDDEQYRRRVRMLKLLIALGADLNCRDSNGRTALHLSAWLDDTKVTQLLLSDGATVDAVDSEGRTPLMLSALANSQSTARLLLSNGARLDWRSIDGRSILSIAVQMNHFRFVRLLLRSGMSTDVKDLNGSSALDWIEKMNEKQRSKWKSLLARYDRRS